LSKLEKLNLRQNAFEGKIPEEIGDLKRLSKLDLCHNHFTGSLAKELGQLTELTELRLHCNQFSGEIISRSLFLLHADCLLRWWPIGDV
jgi:Leucine-rich repeat (LRR) protein